MTITMASLTKEQVKEIADQFDCGFCCFVHRQTGEIISIPDTLRHPEMDTEVWENEQEKLDNNFGEYFEIEHLESSDSFEIMVDFTDQLDDNNEFKRQLITALNKKKPFKEFKLVIDNLGIYRQQWFDFKNEQLKQWVIDKFEKATQYDRKNGSS